MKRRRSHLHFLEDILTAMGKIQRYTEDLDRDSFEDNELVVDGVIRNLEVIGEAAGNIPESVRSRHPDVPWKKMIGLRNIVAHEYFGIDLGIVWEIATRNIKETKAVVESVLEAYRVEKGE